MSEAQYRTNNNYRQDDDFIKSIKGKGKGQSDTGETAKEYSQDVKEGITCGQDDNQIVIWEVYCREKGSRRIYVETCSPLRHKEEVRPRFALPYNRHVFKNGDMPPFVKIRTEINGKSYYSPRGIIELTAPWEAILNKSFNAKGEWMDHFNQPAYKNTGGGIVANTQNFQRGPGAILPIGLEPVESPRPPISFDEEMASTRAWAEYRVNIPDLGSGEHLMGRTQGKDTATKINAILGQSGQVNDIRSRIFRLDLGDVLNMAWSILLQYDAESVKYITNDDQLQELDKTALHDDYLITPNGSPDSWNKGQQLQQAMALYQMLENKPHIKQDELTKMLLEAKESALVKKLYQDPGEHQQDEAYQQSVEITTMLQGFGAPIRKSDDDKAHLQLGLQFAQGRMSEQNPTTPLQSKLIALHFRSHLQQLMDKKDPLAAPMMRQWTPLLQILDQLSALPMQQGAPAGNGTSAQGEASTPAAPGAQKPPDPVSDATKAGNMLSSLIAKGVPITAEQINPVLGVLGLPPIQPAQPNPMETMP